MERRAAARQISGPVLDVGGRFMLDGATYARGAELGFAGLDFYVVGRGGVLGDVPGEVVAASFVFWEPTTIVANWDAGRAVMPPARAAAEFLSLGHRWGRDHLSDGLPAGRLAELGRRVTDAADAAACCLFAAWRLVPWPDDDRAAALHAVHLLRELRGGLHGLATRAAGLTPLQAVAVRPGAGLPFMGWPSELPESRDLHARWEAAESATDDLVAEALGVLGDDDLDELVDLVGRLTP